MQGPHTLHKGCQHCVLRRGGEREREGGGGSASTANDSATVDRTTLLWKVEASCLEHTLAAEEGSYSAEGKEEDCSKKYRRGTFRTLHLRFIFHPLGSVVPLLHTRWIEACRIWLLAI